MASFCHKPPLRDPASKLTINLLLPRLSKVFHSVPASNGNENELSDIAMDSLRSIMCWTLLEARPRLLKRGKRRRGMVREFVKTGMSSTGSRVSSAGAGSRALLESVEKGVPQLRKTIKEFQKKGTKPKVRKGDGDSLLVAALLAEIAEGVGGESGAGAQPFHDIARLMRTSNATVFRSEKDQAISVGAYSAFTARLARDEARSAGLVRDLLIGNVGEESGTRLIEDRSPS